MLNGIKNKITGDPRISNLLWAIKGLWGDSLEKANKRHFSSRTAHMIPDYINNNTMRKLHIGSQDNVLPGWLNVDLFAGFEGVAFMDATLPFPMESDTFDYIFSEHMIEHIGYDEADHMIRECFRVLKSGGKIRIATPGLDKFISVRNNPLSDTLVQYTENLVQATHKTKVPPHIDYAINYIVYNYHHRFIHSTYTLTHLLESNGFRNVCSVSVHKSTDENLQNLEAHTKLISEELYNFETIILEAVK